jgi:competence CoiA-like predicted nuclease
MALFVKTFFFLFKIKILTNRLKHKLKHLKFSYLCHIKYFFKKKKNTISKTHSPKEPLSLNNITRDWLREAKLLSQVGRLTLTKSIGVHSQA